MNPSEGSPKNRKSPSPIRTQVDYQPQIKKSVMLNESDLDSGMKHWEEYKVKGIKMQRRSYHSASFYKQTLYIYGGYEINGGNLEDFVKVDLSPNKPVYEWEEVIPTSETRPGPRSRHTTIVHKDKLYIYGGQINAVVNTDSLMSFDFNTLQWSNIQTQGDPLPKIDSHCSILWEKGDGKASMIVAGGFISGPNGGYSNAVYEYDLDENKSRVLFKNQEVDPTSTQTSIPQGRVALGAAIYKNMLYVFGGNEGSSKLNDLWKFDLKEKKWARVKTEGPTLPEPRSGHSLICYNDTLILFGGILDITHEKNDIYIFPIQKPSWINVEKETRWIFEEPDRQPPSPTKKPTVILDKDGSKSPGRRSPSPVRSSSPVRTSSPKKFLLGKDISLDNSADEGYNSLQRTKNADKKNSVSKSPTNKYGKIKLLEAIPIEGSQGDDSRFGDEEVSMQQTSKHATRKEFKSSIEEKQERDRQMKKMMLLKEFEVTDDKAKDNLTIVTPALEAMQKAIKSLGINEKSKEKPEATLYTTLAGLDAIRAYAEKTTDDGNPIRVGVKPVARDGHSATLLNNKMFIFGGDRHKISFNDLFALNLKFFDSVNL